MRESVFHVFNETKNLVEVGLGDQTITIIDIIFLDKTSSINIIFMWQKRNKDYLRHTDYLYAQLKVKTAAQHEFTRTDAFTC